MENVYYLMIKYLNIFAAWVLKLLRYSGKFAITVFVIYSNFL